jgi:hypothetical protein
MFSEGGRNMEKKETVNVNKGSIRELKVTHANFVYRKQHLAAMSN